MASIRKRNKKGGYQVQCGVVDGADLAGSPDSRAWLTEQLPVMTKVVVVGATVVLDPTELGSRMAGVLG